MFRAAARPCLPCHPAAFALGANPSSISRARVVPAWSLRTALNDPAIGPPSTSRPVRRTGTVPALSDPWAKDSAEAASRSSSMAPNSSPRASASSESTGTVQNGSAGSSKEVDATQHFRILKEDLVYSRYVRVFNRVVEQPAASQHTKGKPHATQVVEYDIVASRAKSCHFCTVFPFHSVRKTVTLLREYAQGANDMAYTVPCGGLSESHTSAEDCARKELSEEAFLCGGVLIRLLDASHPGLLEVKWCQNRFTPFLVIDAQPDPSPRPRDAEEFIETHEVDIPTLKQIMYSGNMMLPSVVTCSMALEKLQGQGLL